MKLPWPSYLVATGLFALATLSTFIAVFTNPYPDFNGSGYDTGHGFGYWASLILVIVGTVLSCGCSRPVASYRAPWATCPTSDRRVLAGPSRRAADPTDEASAGVRNAYPGTLLSEAAAIGLRA